MREKTRLHIEPWHLFAYSLLGVALKAGLRGEKGCEGLLRMLAQRNEGLGSIINLDGKVEFFEDVRYIRNYVSNPSD